MGLSDFLEDLAGIEKKAITDDNDSNDELDSLELEDWQKEEVRKGNYNPWSFEEDGEKEEDDYYYDDDEV